MRDEGVEDVKQFDIFSILMPMIDKLLLRARGIIEPVINQLANRAFKESKPH